jgi:hypothetical protein
MHADMHACTAIAALVAPTSSDMTLPARRFSKLSLAMMVMGSTLLTVVLRGPVKRPSCSE